MRLRRILLLSMFAAVCSPAAIVAGADQCKRIEGKLATVRVSENCTSPVNFCASGVVTGKDLISGTTQAPCWVSCRRLDCPELNRRRRCRTRASGRFRPRTER